MICVLTNLPIYFLKLKNQLKTIKFLRNALEDHLKLEANACKNNTPFSIPKRNQSNGTQYTSNTKTTTATRSLSVQQTDKLQSSSSAGASQTSNTANVANFIVRQPLTTSSSIYSPTKLNNSVGSATTSLPQSAQTNKWNWWKSNAS